jgi:hypothetical protein
VRGKQCSLRDQKNENRVLFCSAPAIRATDLITTVHTLLGHAVFWYDGHYGSCTIIFDSCPWCNRAPAPLMFWCRQIGVIFPPTVSSLAPRPAQLPRATMPVQCTGTKSTQSHMTRQQPTITSHELKRYASIITRPTLSIQHAWPAWKYQQELLGRKWMPTFLQVLQC